MANWFEDTINISDEDKEKYFVDFGKRKYVPQFLQEDPVLSQIYRTQGYEIGKFNYYIDDLIKQCFITTATWGLKYWEEEFGITIDETDSLENRRSRVLAKKRKQDVCNIPTMKKICASYSNGEVEIIPHYEEYYFTIKFVSTKGIPEKIQNIYDDIEEIKPAHLNVVYEFNYQRWGELYGNPDNTNPYKWGELKMFSWENVMNGQIYHNNDWYTKSELVTEDGSNIVTGDGSIIELVEIIE